MTTKQRQIRRFHALLGNLNLRHRKEAILSGYQVESTNDLSEDQLEGLNASLQNQLDLQKQKEEKALKKWRSVVLTLLNEYGVYKNKESWGAVNNFLMKPRIAGKLLYKMSVEEMQTLSRKLRKLIREKNAKIEKENFLAINN